MSRPPTVHQLYKRLETVGRGAYGSVHRGLHIPTGNVVALKIINLDTEDDDVADIQREVALLTQLRDAPNVTKYYGCYLDGPRVWIVMEFAQGGSLHTLMKACNNGVIEEKYIVIIVREVLMGLGYLHRSAIIHRDIKAANVLITAAGKVMLCDFGISALLATTSSKRNTFIGTPYWMAPEVAQAVPIYDTKADIWSLGILVYEMAKGSPPHSNLEATKVLQLIPRSKPPRLIEGEGTKDMREFVSLCLKESPNERLPPDELSKSKWIKSASKTSVSVLKDLILRYDTWAQGGGVRTSIADSMHWEDARESRSSSPVDDDWEFETGANYTTNLDGDPLSSGSTADPTSLHNSTIRPPATSKVPTSLRLLFQDDTTLPSDPFNIPTTLPLLSVNNTLTSPSMDSLTPTRDLSSSSLPKPSILHRKRSQSSDVGGRSLGSSEYRFPIRPLNLTPPLTISNSNNTGGRGNDGRKPVTRKPSLIRQASVAVMETVSTPPLLPPVPPFANFDRKHKNNGSSDHIMQSVPGLKDVLKVSHLTSEHQFGISDLLPPSPSAFPPNNRTYSPSAGAPPGNGEKPQAFNFIYPSTSGLSSSPSRSISPPLDINQSSQSTSIQVDTYNHGPPIRPLDLGALMNSRDDTHSELARTVEELGQLLRVIESGLNDLLVAPAVDVIEEEQEDSSSHVDGSFLLRDVNYSQQIAERGVT